MEFKAGATPVPGGGFRRSAARGAAWNYGIYLASKVALFASTVVVAHLVAPSEFGLVALGLTVLTYVDAVNEFGLGAAVIYLDREDSTAGSTAFFLSMLTGSLTALALIAAAAPIASFFSEPRLTAVIRVLALTFVISSLTTVHEARLRRHLAFRRRVIPEVSKAGVKGTVSIVLALAGLGAWALVWGQVAGVIVSTAGYWLASPWRPHFEWDRAVARKVLTYGGSTMLVSILAVLVRDVDYAVIGRRLDTKQLGFYSLGFRMPDLAIMGICYAVSQAVFPVLARLREDPVALEAGFRRTMGALVLVTAPVASGLALVSHDLVRFAYGERWAPTGSVMRIVSLYFLAVTIQFVVGDAYKATGRQRILSSMLIVRLPIALALLWAVAPRGILAVAGAQLALSATFTVIQLAFATRFLHVRSIELIKGLLPATVSGIVMIVVGIGVQSATAGWAAEWRLAVTVPACALTYGLMAMATGRTLLLSLIATLRPSPSTAAGAPSL